MRFIDRIRPARPEHFFTMEGYRVWDPSVIADETTGRYHLYGSRWPSQFGGPGWLTDSRIFRAEGDSPLGPFEFSEQLDHLTDADWCRHMNHNPKAMKIGDTYCLFYIGTHWNEDGARAREDRESWRRVWCNKQIGVATAPGPAGPWTPSPANPVLSPRPDQWDRCLTSNPTVLATREGRIHLVHKSASGIGMGTLVQKLGLAVADSVHGPFERAGHSPLFDHNIEDPFIWSEGGHYWMIAKDMTGDVCGVRKAGILYTSDDAIDWRLADEPLAYDLWVEWADDARQEFFKLERAHLYLEAGRSRVLYHAASLGPNDACGILARELAPW